MSSASFEDLQRRLLLAFRRGEDMDVEERNDQISICSINLRSSVFSGGPTHRRREEDVYVPA